MTFQQAAIAIKRAWPEWKLLPTSRWISWNKECHIEFSIYVKEARSIKERKGYEAMIWIIESPENSQQWDAWINLIQ
jgi:hypothetical protein